MAEKLTSAGMMPSLPELGKALLHAKTGTRPPAWTPAGRAGPGALIAGDTRAEKALMLYGPTRTGKTKLAQLAAGVKTGFHPDGRQRAGNAAYRKSIAEAARRFDGFGSFNLVVFTEHESTG